MEATLAADTSAVFDAGGILGGIVAGLITDRGSCYATVCVIMLALGMPGVSLIHYLTYFFPKLFTFLRCLKHALLDC